MIGSSKGISPLIAAVLLIAFTVSIASISGPFFKRLMTDTTAGTSNTTDKILESTQNSLEIKDAKYSPINEHTNVTVQNTGQNTVKEVTVSVISDSPEAKKFDTELSPGEVEIFTVESSGSQDVQSVQINTDNGLTKKSDKLSDKETKDSIGEIGKKNVKNAEWKEVSFRLKYEFPPIVAGSTMSKKSEGENALIPQIRNITTSSAEIRLCEPDNFGVGCNSSLGTETMSYLVIDRNKTAKIEGIETATNDFQITSDYSREDFSYKESYSERPLHFSSVNNVTQSYQSIIGEGWATGDDGGKKRHYACLVNGSSGDRCGDINKDGYIGYVIMERNFPQNKLENFDTRIIKSKDSGLWNKSAFREEKSDPVGIMSMNWAWKSFPKIPEIKNVTGDSFWYRHCIYTSGDNCGSDNTEIPSLGVAEPGVIYYR